MSISRAKGLIKPPGQLFYADVECYCHDTHTHLCIGIFTVAAFPYQPLFRIGRHCSKYSGGASEGTPVNRP